MSVLGVAVDGVFASWWWRCFGVVVCQWCFCGCFFCIGLRSGTFCGMCLKPFLDDSSGLVAAVLCIVLLWYHFL